MWYKMALNASSRKKTINRGRSRGWCWRPLDADPAHASVTVHIWGARHCLSPGFPPTPMVFFPAFLLHCPLPFLLEHHGSSSHSLQDLVAAWWPLAEVSDKSHAPRWKGAHTVATAISENKPAKQKPYYKYLKILFWCIEIQVLIIAFHKCSKCEIV